MMGQLAATLGLGAIITAVCWYFRPPVVTPVSKECREYWQRQAMRQGDDPADPDRMTL